MAVFKTLTSGLARAYFAAIAGKAWAKKEFFITMPAMKPFWHTLKRELVQGAGYDAPEQAQMYVFKYIETYYN